jgi:hypothetical protein
MLLMLMYQSVLYTTQMAEKYVFDTAGSTGILL